MDHKTLNPKHEGGISVLVYRSIELGEDYASVIFFHSSGLTFIKKFPFSTTEDAKSFVRDYSEESAIDLAERVVTP